MQTGRYQWAFHHARIKLNCIGIISAARANENGCAVFETAVFLETVGAHCMSPVI